MRDYTWPSVYFAYLFFALSCGARDLLLRALLEGRVLEQGRRRDQVSESSKKKVNHGTDETQD